MKKMIPVWFFVGVLLSLYGVLILFAGIGDFAGRGGARIAMSQLHLQLWWGGALLVLGLVYTLRFWPWTHDQNQLLQEESSRTPKER